MPRPTFALSRWSDPDDDAVAGWLRHVEAVRAARPVDPAIVAGVLAAEAALLGRPRPARAVAAKPRRGA